MFEEVPRERRGLSQLTATRVALGPFVVGGGVLLGMLGTSVAVAATVITAGTIAVHEYTAAAGRAPIIPPTTSATVTSTPNRPGSAGVSTVVDPATPSAAASGLAPAGPGPGASTTATTRPGTVARSVARVAPGTPTAPRTDALTASTPPGSPDSARGHGNPGPSGSATGPAGNALVDITGYDRVTDRLTYRYAMVSVGAGPGHSDVYSLAAPTVYFAGLAADLTVESGGAICQPAGGYCTPAQLVTAASNGFFAELAVDPSGLVHSVIERDNVRFGGGPVPSASPAPSASAAAQPAPSASPSLS